MVFVLRSEACSVSGHFPCNVACCRSAPYIPYQYSTTLADLSTPSTSSTRFTTSGHSLRASSDGSDTSASPSEKRGSAVAMETITLTQVRLFKTREQEEEDLGNAGVFTAFMGGTDYWYRNAVNRCFLLIIHKKFKQLHKT